MVINTDGFYHVVYRWRGEVASEDITVISNNHDVLVYLTPNLSISYKTPEQWIN